MDSKKRSSPSEAHPQPLVKKTTTSIGSSYSEAETEALSRKRVTSSSSSSKVCVVCHSPAALNYGYGIFIVDLGLDSGGGGGGDVDGSDFTSRDPSIRFDDKGFPYGAFCVLDSTLYVVEGCHRDDNPMGKSMFTYKLPSLDVSNLCLDKSMLDIDSHMNHSKFAPIATPTPDGKILLFSSTINVFDPVQMGAGEMGAHVCDFELYDPANQSWAKLPRIRPISAPRYNLFYIQAFGFMETSVLVIQTDIGMFSLDLQPPHTKPWKELCNLGVHSSFPQTGFSFVLVGKDLCLDLYFAYDIGGSYEREEVAEAGDFSSRLFYSPQEGDFYSRRFYGLPQLSSFPDPDDGGDFYLSEVGAVTPLLDLDDDVNPQNCKFSVFQIAINQTTMHPCMIIDAYSCDVEKCKKELIKHREEDKEFHTMERVPFPLPGTTKVKTLKFVLDDHCTDWFFPLSFSYIPAGTSSTSCASS